MRTFYRNYAVLQLRYINFIPQPTVYIYTLYIYTLYIYIYIYIIHIYNLDTYI